MHVFPFHNFYGMFYWEIGCAVDFIARYGPSYCLMCWFFATLWIMICTLVDTCRGELPGKQEYTVYIAMAIFIALSPLIGLVFIPYMLLTLLWCVCYVGFNVGLTCLRCIL